RSSGPPWHLLEPTGRSQGAMSGQPVRPPSRPQGLLRGCWQAPATRMHGVGQRPRSGRGGRRTSAWHSLISGYHLAKGCLRGARGGSSTLARVINYGQIPVLQHVRSPELDGLSEDPSGPSHSGVTEFLLLRYINSPTRTKNLLEALRGPHGDPTVTW